MSRDCCVALPRGAMGLSAVFDCGISGSYSLTIFNSFWLIAIVCSNTQMAMFKKVRDTEQLRINMKTAFRHILCMLMEDSFGILYFLVHLICDCGNTRMGKKI